MRGFLYLKESLPTSGLGLGVNIYIARRDLPVTFFENSSSGQKDRESK